MGKRLIIMLFALVGSVAALAQTGTAVNRSFAKVSEEMREPGKKFYLVDFSGLENQGAKYTFMDLVAAESRIFPVSVIRDDNTVLLCAFESVLSEPDAYILLEDLKRRALAGSGSDASSEKYKLK